jgi:hypothetical protein
MRNFSSSNLDTRKSYKYTNQITTKMSDDKLDHTKIDSCNQSFAKVIKELESISENTKSKEIHVQATNAIAQVKGAQQLTANLINSEIKFEKERLEEVKRKKIEETSK